MPKAILALSKGSAYDDKPEDRYHFPKTYLAQVQRVLGDLIVYYEPRRDRGLSSSGGRQAYFAVARVVRIEEDPQRDGYYYAHLVEFLPFERAVPFQESGFYYESALQKADGKTNKGQFGRSVRAIPEDEFERILVAGFTLELPEWERHDAVAEPEPAYAVRPLVSIIVTRPFRDQVFKHRVRDAYQNTCAISGLSLLNGGGDLRFKRRTSYPFRKMVQTLSAMDLR